MGELQRVSCVGGTWKEVATVEKREKSTERRELEGLKGWSLKGVKLNGGKISGGDVSPVIAVTHLP